MPLTYNKPTVGGSRDAWGGILNQNWDDLAALLTQFDGRITTNTAASGTNSNGLFVRLGTAQACFADVLIRPEDGEQFFSFPANFISEPWVGLCGRRTEKSPLGGSGYSQRARAYNETMIAPDGLTRWACRVALDQSTTTGNRDQYHARLIAIGLWK